MVSNNSAEVKGTKEADSRIGLGKFLSVALLVGTIKSLVRYSYVWPTGLYCVHFVSCTSIV